MGTQSDLAAAIEERRKRIQRLSEEVESLEEAQALLAKQRRSPATPKKEKVRTGDSGAWIPDAIKLFDDGKEHSLAEVTQLVGQRGHTVTASAISLYLSRAHKKGSLKRVRKGVYVK
jgi:hypothetical protein